MNSKTFTLFLLSVLLLNTIITTAQQKEDLSKYVWDLSPLFAGQREWEAERNIIEKKILDLEKYRGTLGRNAASLADAMDAVFDLRSKAGKMYLYGLLNYETNVNSDQAMLQYDVGTGFESKVESAVSFIREEIKNIGKEKIEEWIHTEPRLEKHKRRLNRIIYEAPYTSINESQKIVESMSRWPRLAVDAYDNFYNSDLGWPVVKSESGEEIAADPGAYRSAIRGPENPDREKIINSFLKKLESLQDAFGLLFTRRIEADLTIAKSRGFKEGMEALWYLRDGMPVGSHKIAIEVAESNFSTLNKYLKLRRKALGIERMTFADVFTRTKLGKKFTVKETIQNYLNASRIFGVEYQRKLKERIEKPWMHLPPSENKSGTYGIFPPINDAPPFILMSYTGSLASSRALAGALGLMMAFADIAETNPSDTRDDPGIFSNAIIYVANLIYYDYLKNNAEDINEKIAYVLDELDLLVSRMYRYPMMADFETRIQDLIIENDNPTGSTVSKIYLETLRKYYGNNSSTMKIDDIYSYDWITNGILFLSYEDQFWYGAGAAAAAMYEKLQNNDKSILNFFNKGFGVNESDRSYKMLLNAGIDITIEEPYEILVNRIDILCNELESLLNYKNIK